MIARFVERTYALLLYAYPPDLRRAHAAEMRQCALRTRELGIRIALGADASQIRSLVIRDGVRPVAGGLACGIVLALLASRLAAAFLRGITPWDPLTYVTVALILAAVAFTATWIPARRAAALDPIRALRQE